MTTYIEKLAIIPLAAYENLIKVIRDLENIEKIKNITIVKGEPCVNLHITYTDCKLEQYKSCDRLFIDCSFVLSILSEENTILLVEYTVGT